jgi:uncharacterized membrane-anchored protein
MKFKLFVIVLCLQTACILGMTLIQERNLLLGTVILLETVPRDPRDLLRGDYIVLNYKIGSLPETLIKSANTQLEEEGTPVWVELEKHGEFHEAVGVYATRSAVPAGNVMLKGKTEYRWLIDPGLSVNYGIDRYYVREGTGNPQSKITVQVVVPPSGQAIIKEVFVDGRPYAQAMKGQSHP